MSDSTIFGSSEGTSSSETSQISVLTAEEVGDILHLNSKVVKFLQKGPGDDQDPLLILNYEDAFMNLGNYTTNKAAVTNILVNAGGIKIVDDVFKFVDWHMIRAARDQMSAAMPWLFYDPAGTTAYLNNGQWIPYQTQQTIHSTVVTWFPEERGKHTIVPYEFFSR